MRALAVLVLDPAGNTCSPARCFGLPSRHLTPASSICLRGRSTATVARGGGLQRSRERLQNISWKEPSLPVCSSGSRVTSHTPASWQSRSSRGLQRTLRSSPPPWASSSAGGASREVELPSEQEKFSLAFLAREGKP